MSVFKKHGQLSSITAPTLIMVGAKDDVATPAIVAGIQAQIVGSRLVNFETGHFMMAEHPGGFRRVPGEFLHSLKKKIVALRLTLHCRICRHTTTSSIFLKILRFIQRAARASAVSLHISPAISLSTVVIFLAFSSFPSSSCSGTQLA